MPAQALDPFNLDEFAQELMTGGTWENVTFASFGVLKEIIDGGCAKAFVWPDEGVFLKDGTFKFNAAHKKFQPLLVDFFSAKMLLAGYNNLSKEANKEKFVVWVSKSRGHFGSIFEIVEKSVTLKYR